MKKGVYEDRNIRNVTGETLRPGGLFTTERAISFCNLKKDDRALDIGCGMGATVNYLQNEIKIETYGIDPSPILIKTGKQKFNLDLDLGKGENLPYEDSYFDIVFTECTLSLMDDYKKTVKEIYRVLKPEGYYIISDFYGRKPEYIRDLNKIEIQTCLTNIFELDFLSEEIQKNGFEILNLEEWTSLLRKLTVEIIFKYGSMKKFWNITTCRNCDDFIEKLKLCKPGYFLMINKRRI